MGAACTEGQGRVIKIPVASGVRADQRRWQRKCFLAACAGGYEEIVEMLLNNGAKIAINDAYNDAIQVASDAGFVGIVKLLLDQAASYSTTMASRANAMPAEQVSLGKRRRLEKGLFPSTA